MILFSTLHRSPVTVVVLVHGLEPAHVVVGVGHEVDVDQAGDSGRTRGVAARAETRGRGLDISITIFKLIILR